MTRVTFSSVVVGGYSYLGGFALGIAGKSTITVSRKQIVVIEFKGLTIVG